MINLEIREKKPYSTEDAIDLWNTAVNQYRRVNGSDYINNTYFSIRHEDIELSKRVRLFVGVPSSSNSCEILLYVSIGRNAKERKPCSIKVTNVDPHMVVKMIDACVTEMEKYQNIKDTMNNEVHEKYRDSFKRGTWGDINFMANRNRVNDEPKCIEIKEDDEVNFSAFDQDEIDNAVAIGGNSIEAVKEELAKVATTLPVEKEVLPSVPVIVEEPVEEPVVEKQSKVEKPKNEIRFAVGISGISLEAFEKWMSYHPEGSYEII